MSALLVVTQVLRTGKYFWAAGFSAVAVLFDPIVPIALSGNVSLLGGLPARVFRLAGYVEGSANTLSLDNPSGPRTESM